MNKTKIEIGRNPESDICVDSTMRTVSGSHSSIEYKNGVLYYTDHSTNGTTINGRRINNETVEIGYGDKIMLADVYELDWAQIRSFFSSLSRDTKIIGASNPTSRKTEHYTPGQQSNANAVNSRVTVNYKPQKTKSEDNFVSTPLPSNMGEIVGKWNWGAFLCSWLWAAFHRKYWPLIVLLLSVIPYVGQIAQIMLAFYLGVNGSRIAWECRKYSTFESYRKAQKRWSVAGIFIFLLMLLFNALSLYIVLSFL